MTVIMTKPVLKIDPEFQAKIPPLTEEEFKQLEENILRDGEVYDPIIIWNGTIVDGHNRYKIIQANPWLEWRVREMKFADRWEAIDWMCSNQLGRRNLSDVNRTYLIGKQYEARKHCVGAPNKNQNRKIQLGHCGPIESRNYEGTAGEIAKENNVGINTVKRAEKFAKGIDAIRTVSPKTASDILSGKKEILKSVVKQIGTAPEPERPALITAVIEGKPLPKKEPSPKSEPKPIPPSSQPDTPTFSFDKPISTRTKAGQQLMSEIRTVIENQGNGEIIKPTLSVVSEMLMYDVQAMIERFHDFMNTNQEIATEEIVKHIKASIDQLSMLKEVLQNS